MPPKRTFARLDAFTRGQIWGMKLGGMPREEMLEHVWKKDGTELTLHTLDDVIKKKIDYPDWMGEDSCAGGRNRELTPKEEKQVVDLVFKERGQAKVTVGYCKKRLQYLRWVDDTTIAEVLHRAGLKWLTRRMKSWVPDAHKEKRLGYSESVQQGPRTSPTFAHSPGISAYWHPSYAFLTDVDRLSDRRAHLSTNFLTDVVPYKEICKVVFLYMIFTSVKEPRRR